MADISKIKVPSGSTYNVKDLEAIKGLSVSGKTITYTKRNGKTGTLTTQDTIYNNATTSVDGLMSSEDKAKLNTVCNDSDSNTYAAVGNDSSDYSGWYKVASGTLSGSNSRYLMFLVSETKSDHTGILVVNLRCNNTTAVVIKQFGWLARLPELDVNNFIIDVSVNNTWTIYQRVVSAYHRTYYKLIHNTNSMTYNVCTDQSSLTLYKIADKEATTPTGTASADLSVSLKASFDNNNQRIDSYVKSLSINDKTITVTKGDGTTNTLITKDTDTTYTNATTSVDGLMSSEDKKKVNSICVDSSNKTYAIVGGSTSGWYKVANGTLSGRNTRYMVFMVNETKSDYDGLLVLNLRCDGTSSIDIKQFGWLVKKSDVDNNNYIVSVSNNTWTLYQRAVNTSYKTFYNLIQNTGSLSYNPNITDNTLNLYTSASKETTTPTGTSCTDVGMVLSAINDSNGERIDSYVKNLSLTSRTITITKGDGTTSTLITKDTTYKAGTGIKLASSTFSNSGVISIASGTENGTISVNTGGTTANVAVNGLGTAAYTTASNGIFTPELKYSLSSITTAINNADLATIVSGNGYYSQNGKSVYVNISFQFNCIYTGVYLAITGLPFAFNATAGSAIADLNVSYSNINYGKDVHAQIYNGQSGMYLTVCDTNSNMVQKPCVTNTNSNSTLLRISGTYSIL